jgi:hypothetical protein
LTLNPTKPRRILRKSHEKRRMARPMPTDFHIDLIFVSTSTPPKEKNIIAPVAIAMSTTIIKLSFHKAKAMRL